MKETDPSCGERLWEEYPPVQEEHDVIQAIRSMHTRTGALS